MINWIVSSSVLVLIVMTLRYILKEKISLRLRYALWAMVLLRLLLPVNIGNSSISIMNLTDKLSEETIWQSAHAGASEGVYHEPDSVQELLKNNYESGRVYILDYVGGNTEPAVKNDSIDSNEKADFVKAANTAIILKDIIMYIWIVGMIIAGTWFAAVNLKFLLRIKKDSYLAGNDTVAVLPVYVTSSIETPCVYGLFLPKVYVTPEVIKDTKIYRHVIEHESTHYRHGDHIWCALRTIAVVIHWYNPLVWAAAFLSKKDSELACDEGTIRRIGEEERLEYGRTLINMTCKKKRDLFVVATMMSGTKKSMKERIILIVKKPRTAIYSLVTVVVIAVAAIGCTFTGAEAKGRAADNFAEMALNANEEKQGEQVVLSDNKAVPATITFANSSAQKATYTWQIENGVLTFSGTGTIQRGAYLNENFYSVVINEGINGIGPGAFADCGKLEKVTMADSVTMIEAWAFLECDRLSEIEFSKNCTEFGIKAFEGTKWLETARKTADVVVNDMLIASARVIKAKEPEVDPVRVIYGTKDSVYYKYSSRQGVTFEELDAKATEAFNLGTELLYVYNYGGLGLTLVRRGWPAEDTFIAKLPKDVEKISSLLNSYEWTQVEAIDTDEYDYQVIAASAEGSRYMAFYDMGSTAVDYFDGVKHTYWISESTKDNTTAAKEIKKIYDAFEASVVNVEIYGDYAEEAAGYFAKTGYAQHIASLTLGNCYKYSTCRVNDWGITLTVANRSVSGWMDIEYTWERFGEKFNRHIEFVLENNGNEWVCTELTAKE